MYDRPFCARCGANLVCNNCFGTLEKVKRAWGEGYDGYYSDEEDIYFCPPCSGLSKASFPSDGETPPEIVSKCVYYALLNIYRGTRVNRLIDNRACKECSANPDSPMVPTYSYKGELKNGIIVLGTYEAQVQFQHDNKKLSMRIEYTKEHRKSASESYVSDKIFDWDTSTGNFEQEVKDKENIKGTVEAPGQRISIKTPDSREAVIFNPCQLIAHCTAKSAKN